MQCTSRIPLFLGLTAFVFTGVFVNHGLVDSPLPAGPGLTLDESFNIDQGVYLAEALEQHGPLLFEPQTAREVFQAKRFLPDHPPLGRLLIGLAHQSTSWLIPGSEGTVYNVAAARLGSCLAFAIMVFAMTRFAMRFYDVSTAIATGLMLIGLPHLMGHARLAALETSTNLAWMAAVLPLMTWWTGEKPPSLYRVLISGIFLGLLLLTKVQGILLPPAVVVWSLVRFRQQAFLPLVLWGLCGGCVFLAGWPWVWSDPVNHVLQYLGRTTERPTLYCWYLGQRFDDRMVPWHYPFVMLLLSLPAWTLAGIGLRICQGRLDRREQFLLLASAVPLFVFAMPGVPVYDGTRLFLVSLPGVAFMAGRGIGPFLNSTVPLSAVFRRGTVDHDDPGHARNAGSVERKASAAFHWSGRTLLTVALLLVVPIPWTLQPFAINQYGMLAGGNRGAAALGLEAGYWADAMNGDFWNSVPEGSTVYVAPVSHQFQLPDLEMLVPVIQRRKIRLIAWEYDLKKQHGLLLMIHRLADLRVNLRVDPVGSQQISDVRLSGVLLARLIRAEPSKSVTW